jgi:ribosomal protein S18 acetylase RimI-like enzyme
MAHVAERVDRLAHDARHVAARVDDRVEVAAAQLVEPAVAVAAQLLGLREELGPRLAAVEERHVVAVRERGVDDVTAEELSATEDEHAHYAHPMHIRQADRVDYPVVIGVVDQWWGGRPMAAMLPKLFFVHFRDTSFVAEDDDAIAGFLCGFRSQTYEDEAYIHFVGVDPERRGAGIARSLYERFFEAVAPRTIVRAVTSPVNEGSIAFHRALGFDVDTVDEDYDGQGEARVLLVKRL